MVFVPPFVLLLDSLSPFRFSPRSSFRSSVRFARFVPRHVFRLAVRFVCFVWACRRGGGSCGGVWGGAVGLSSGVARWRGVCRVRRFCQLVFVGVGGGFWFSVLLVWRLVCSARFGGAGGAFPVLRVSVGGGCGCDVASSRFLVPCGRPVPSRLLFVVAVALFGLVPSGVSCGGVFGVGSLERGGMVVRGCWMWAVRCSWCGSGTVWRVVDRAVGGSVMPCRVAGCAVRDDGRDDGRDDERAVVVSSI